MKKPTIAITLMMLLAIMISCGDSSVHSEDQGMNSLDLDIVSEKEISEGEIPAAIIDDIKARHADAVLHDIDELTLNGGGKAYEIDVETSEGNFEFTYDHDGVFLGMIEDDDEGDTDEEDGEEDEEEDDEE